MDNIKENMVANKLTPAFPTHPGAILKDELEYRGILRKLRHIAAL